MSFPMYLPVEFSISVFCFQKQMNYIVCVVCIVNHRHWLSTFYVLVEVCIFICDLCLESSKAIDMCKTNDSL